MRLRTLGAVFVLAGCSGSAADQSTNQPTVALTTTATPAAAVDFEAVDPARGAVGAALTYVASTDSLMAHSPIGRTEILRSLLVPTAVAEQATSFQRVADQLTETLDLPVERLVWVEAPLTANVVLTDDSSATVDVWTVSILGAPAGGSPQQVWRTVHVELERIEGRWLVAGASADAGPTPALNELSMQAGWDDFAVVAGWQPVVTGAEL